MYGAEDANMDTCYFYDANPDECGNHDAGSFVASTLCCACGGGIYDGDAPGRDADCVPEEPEDYTFDNFEMQCGAGVSQNCEGKSVAAETGFTEASFKKFVGGAVNVFTSGLNIFLASSTQSFTENMMMGINALRCAVVNAADNAWNFIAAAWWAAYEFEM